MDIRIRNLMGLNDGSREYRQIDGEIDRQTFEFHATHAEVLFGEKGYLATLGPTWFMINDPRFAAIERIAIKEKQGQFSMVRLGVQRQSEDGQFHATAEQAKFLAEVLGEGRYGVRYLRSMRYDAAIVRLFPERSFVIPPKTYEVGLYKYSQLSPEEQQRVENPDITIGIDLVGLYPENATAWHEDFKWHFIHEIAPNCFSRKGDPNDHARFLFDTISAGLLGLVDDYCEIANLQEWVVVDSDFELASDAEMQLGENVVFAEVEMLERALTIRANLRVAAAQILAHLGIDRYMQSEGVDLTETERDHVLRVIYNSNYPEDKPQLLIDVLTYIHGVAQMGPIEYRQSLSDNGFKIQARQHIAGLRDGSIQPINRKTDGVVDAENTPEQKLLDAIQRDPIRLDLFMRLVKVDEELAELARQINDPDSTGLSSEEIENTQARLLTLQTIQGMLIPYLESIDQVVTEEEAGAVVDKILTLDPPRLLPHVWMEENPQETT